MRATDTVEVGRTGLRVTRLGLGGVALSGAPPATDPERATAEKEAVALIQRSLALGVNYLDTAPMYGVGESEARYGEALRGVPRERYVLSTKVGRVLQPPASGGAKATWAFDFSASGVRESFKASLGRLGLERVDIVFVHDPDDHYEQALKEAFPVLVELRAAGVVQGQRRDRRRVVDRAGERILPRLRLGRARLGERARTTGRRCGRAHPAWDGHVSERRINS
jgi:D-threo-aldose 1-dehydrogenase